MRTGYVPRVRAVAYCAVVIVFSVSTGCAVRPGAAAPTQAAANDFDDSVVAGPCSCSATTIDAEDDALRADRAGLTQRWTVALEPHAQPWFDAQPTQAELALAPSSAFRVHCLPSQEPACQDGEFFRAQLSATLTQGSELGRWDVAIARTLGAGLAVSEPIAPPAAWPARAALPEGARVQLAIETLHPLRGEIFVLTAGSQHPVVTLTEQKSE